VSIVAVVDVDLREVEQAIKRMKRAGRSLRPVWQKLRTPMRKDQREHMKRMESPSGSSWPPLAKSTREKRLKKVLRSGKARTKGGRLRKSAQRRVDRVLSARLISRAKIRLFPTFMVIRTPGAAAGVHQLGGRVGHGAFVPRRTFFWVSDQLARMAARLIVQHLRENWEGSKL
jgi:phage gpG-like protein